MVLAWWLNLKPTNTGAWQADVDRPAWVQMDGDRMAIHNLRNCDYRTETDYSNCWSDRTVNLSDLRGADLFFTTWGVRYIGHPIVVSSSETTNTLRFPSRPVTRAAKSTPLSLDSSTI